MPGCFGGLAAAIVITAIATGCGGGNASNDESRTGEHAVIVYLKPAGNEVDFAGLNELEDQLTAAIDNAEAGEYDGNEIALDGSEIILYAYGRNADALYSAMEPTLLASNPGPGSYAIKRYGEADDPNAREVRVELAQ